MRNKMIEPELRFKSAFTGIMKDLHTASFELKTEVTITLLNRALKDKGFMIKHSDKNDTVLDKTSRDINVLNALKVTEFTDINPDPVMLMRDIFNLIEELSIYIPKKTIFDIIRHIKSKPYSNPKALFSTAELF